MLNDLLFSDKVPFAISSKKLHTTTLSCFAPRFVLEDVCGMDEAGESPF